jgi:NAD(P)H-hydrate epimerase
MIRDIPPLPIRSHDAHKGDVGRLVIVGGRCDDRIMLGAPALCANAALAGGAGLVQVVAPRVAVPHIITLAPCAIGCALAEAGELSLASYGIEFGADVMAVGPGLSPAVEGRHLVKLLSEFSGSIVLDADALNTLAAAGMWQPEWPHQVVLTPHPGELRRLLEGRSLDGDVSDRIGSAVALARSCGCVVVHKGAGTVVTDGQRAFVNPTGNSGMATGGTGDVLTGVIAALLGQRMTTMEAAILGVYVHGLAGDMAAEELGRMSLTALHMVDYLADAFCELDPTFHTQD